MKCLIIFSTILVAQVRCRSLLAPTSMSESGIYWDPPQEIATKEEESILPLIGLTNDYVPMNLATAESVSVERKARDNSKDLKPFIMAQGQKLEKLLSEFLKNTVNVNNYGIRPTQWLEQLKMIIKEFSDDVSLRTKNDEEMKNKVMNLSSATKSFQDILNLEDDLLAHYQKNQESNKQITSRHEGSSGLFSLMQESKINGNMSSSDRNEVDRLDDMVVAAQNQLNRIRKYFDLICRKHHHREASKPLMEHNDKHLEINEPQELSIL